MESVGRARNKTDRVCVFLSVGIVGPVWIAVCDVQPITLEVGAVWGAGHLRNRKAGYLRLPVNRFPATNFSIFLLAGHPGFYVVLAIGRSTQFLCRHFHHSEMKISTTKWSCTKKQCHTMQLKLPSSKNSTLTAIFLFTCSETQVLSRSLSAGQESLPVAVGFLAQSRWPSPQTAPPGRTSNRFWGGWVGEAVKETLHTHLGELVDSVQSPDGLAIGTYAVNLLRSYQTWCEVYYQHTTNTGCTTATIYRPTTVHGKDHFYRCILVHIPYFQSA